MRVCEYEYMRDDNFKLCIHIKEIITNTLIVLHNS